MQFEKDPESMSRQEIEKLIGEVQKKMQRAANANDFSALGSMMIIGGDVYYRCTKCGYVEVRSNTAYGVSKRPYTG